ncbi:MAG: aminotransferase class III-fold pyridoxal phosphate-dependent enzyme [Oscillospiraceae bacterium]|jgi:acetylornithine/N-succinyldiaminopimelate aminotransferase|nr:aminotransferase class III-fold pyridoxal phosphate-dependent enzyme [Oscillospiraceae bacterium]
MTTQELTDQYIAGTYARLPVTFVRGAGSLLWDADGKEYIDLGSGIAVNGLGLADAGWADAVAAQLRQIAHASNLYYTQPQAQLAKALCERTGMQKVFFANSGAEANECMIKCARKYAADRWGENTRPGVIALKNSFHGRTLATLAATGQEAFHHDFGPFPTGFYFAEANNIQDLARVLAENEGRCCALLLEPVQGEGGVVPLTQEYVQQAAALVKSREMLLLFDEVQTGNGRTGTLFAFEQYGVQPDLLSTAKGLAGGLPLGACLFGETTKDTLGAGSHGSTFGGNPACAAGALYTLSRIDDALLAEVRAKGARIRQRLEGAPGIQSVTGLGLMLGLQTVRPAKEVLADCLHQGVVVLTAKEKVRLLPALNIPTDVLERALDVICQVAAG